MSPSKKYGVVYTPERLAVFVASLIKKEADKDNFNLHTIVDPACGECALLSAMQLFTDDVSYFGIDIDKETINSFPKREQLKLICEDAILPSQTKKLTAQYWKKRFPSVSAVIANPPWSSEKVYDRTDLEKAGFTLASGQYDSYVLFIELAYEIVKPGGYFGFILPDSLFDNQNDALRRFLAKNTQIRVLARLGEKIFEEVNRAATVIICRKDIPTADNETMCFRFDTNDRKAFLSSNMPLETFYNHKRHSVRQSRFIVNENCIFDVDTHVEDEDLLMKIQKGCIDWDSFFVFGRGVEISKTGDITICPKCCHAQGYTKNQQRKRSKICAHCGLEFALNEHSLRNIVRATPFEGSERIIVGENVRRYMLKGESYIALNIPGIDYKNDGLYAPPKILIRKTGLGIYASIDYSGSMTSQTVYIIRYKTDEGSPPLEYFLALLNSRVVYYYYLKMYGENEWKSHPYFTKKIVFSLPLQPYTDSFIDRKITDLAKQLSKEYTYESDLKLEELIMERYGVNSAERQLIVDEMQRLPNLSSVNGMKFEGRSAYPECIDI